MPEFRTRAGVDGEDMVPRRRQEDDAVDDEGHAGKSVGRAGLERPDGYEVLGVGAVDIIEAAVTGLAVVEAVHEPILRFVGCVD